MAWVSDPSKGAAARSDSDRGPVRHHKACESDRHRCPPTPPQDVMGHRGRKGDPLYDIRRLLLVGEERLSGSARRRIAAALAHLDGDRYDEVACAWVAKELLHEVYAAENLVAARKRLEAFHGWAETVDVHEVDRLARTRRTGRKRPSTITGRGLLTDRPKLST